MAQRRAADGQRQDLPARRRSAWPGAFPPTQTIGQQRNNPLDYRWAMKALLVAMDRWTANGTAPPPSQFPHVGDGTLVSARAAELPEVPGVMTSTAVHRAYRADYGPRSRQMASSREPPEIGTPFQSSCRRWTPTATKWRACRCRSWRFRSPPTRGGTCSTLARGRPTCFRACRVPTSHSPTHRFESKARRRSSPLHRGAIHDKNQYQLGLVTGAAEALVAQGFLLADDVPAVVQNAAHHWDYLASATPSTAGVDKR